MANLQGFNAAEVEPNTGFDPLPAGEYNACIVGSDMKTTKNGSGEYLNLEISILDGTYQNRRLFDKLNLKNSNETAVQIARATLSSICRAVGILEPNDSSELHMKPFRISVGVRKREDTGEMENRIKGYKPRSAQPVTSPQMLATADVVAGYSTAKKGPWEK